MTNLDSSTLAILQQALQFLAEMHTATGLHITGTFVLNGLTVNVNWVTDHYEISV